MLKPPNKLCILITATACGINIVEPKTFEKRRQVTFTTHGVIEVLPSQPFHILVASLFENAMHPPKHMMAHDLLRPWWLPCPLLFIILFLRAPKSVEPNANSVVHPAPCKASKITAHRKVQLSNGKMTGNPHILVAFVHYKPTIDRKLQIQKHSRV